MNNKNDHKYSESTEYDMSEHISQSHPSIHINDNQPYLHGLLIKNDTTTLDSSLNPNPNSNSGEVIDCGEFDSPLTRSL